MPYGGLADWEPDGAEDDPNGCANYRASIMEDDEDEWGNNDALDGLQTDQLVLVRTPESLSMQSPGSPPMR